MLRLSDASFKTNDETAIKGGVFRKAQLATGSSRSYITNGVPLAIIPSVKCKEEILGLYFASDRPIKKKSQPMCLKKKEEVNY